MVGEDRITAAEKSILELKHRLVGVDGNNGITSRVVRLEELVGGIDVSALKDWGERIWHVDRKENCIGREVLETFKREHLKEHEMDIDMKKLALDAEKSRKDSRTTLWVAGLGVIGILGQPLIQQLFKMLFPGGKP